MGDLQRKYPIIKLIRNVMAKAVRSVEAEGLPGHCSSSLYDHLLYPRREQALRRRLCFLSFLSRLGRSRLDPSLGASRPAFGSLWVVRLQSGQLRNNRRLFRRCRQIHDWNGLSSYSGHGGDMKGCTPEGSSRPWFIIIILGPVS
jgi:hypothetical protein